MDEHLLKFLNPHRTASLRFFCDGCFCCSYSTEKISLGRGQRERAAAGPPPVICFKSLLGIRDWIEGGFFPPITALPLKKQERDGGRAEERER